MEIYTGKRLTDMECTRQAIQANAVPIENPVGGIGILLDFMDEKSRADGVQAAGC